MDSKINIEGYHSDGSFNLAYVKEYRATIPTLLISLFNNDWKVLKSEEVLLDTEDNNSYILRDKILMKESISNAIYVAYKYAKKPIENISTNLYVTYIDSTAQTNLKVGDIIKSINGSNVAKKQDIIDIITNLSAGSKIEMVVINNGNEYKRYAYLMQEDGKNKLGLLISSISDYNTNPTVDVKIKDNESGSSGGLITALTIYNSLVPNDITQGLTIVGTGTIDLDGNIGSIGGVEYKLKSAVKAKADVFIVPNDENYEEAIKVKKENNYDIKIIGVSNFNDVLMILDEIK